ncbi:MAG: hypothetical protein QXL94_09210, partial [Candidatus Parvarchaeum sp.]
MQLLYSDEDYKLTFPVARSYCLDHSSVIQTFFSDRLLKTAIAAADIPHKSRLRDRAMDLIPDRPDHLEQFDYLQNIQGAFMDYMDLCYANPKLLHGHYAHPDGIKPYNWIALNRFQNNRNIAPLSEALKNYRGKGVFLTLTVDHNIVKDFKTAWVNVAKQWNLFITRLAKELDIPRTEFHYIWVLEAQSNGYPHIH